LVTGNTADLARAGVRLLDPFEPAARRWTSAGGVDQPGASSGLG
jgi:hypothetical protein